jgi:pyridoxamine 5'-phosphate oxidase
MKNISDIRRNYSLKTLSEKEVSRNPLTQFEQWLDEAIKAGLTEPNALTLSTVNHEGKPSSRVVLLKQVMPDGFVFYTNYNSRKGKELLENPYCALNFLWLELERQVRIEGIASKLTPKESDTYFGSRPESSKLGAWASPQSCIVPNREYLDAAIKEYQQKFEGKSINRPPHWGGYIVKPYLVEFWQGRTNRLHDRICYTKKGEDWIINRLAP